MAKKDAGVYQLKDGGWGYRFTITTDGKKKDVKKTKDESGNPLKTKREAIKARTHAIQQEQNQNIPKSIVRKTVKEVFEEFCEKGRRDRAYQTIRKQDSLWENHLKEHLEIGLWMISVWRKSLIISENYTIRKICPICMWRLS